MIQKFKLRQLKQLLCIYSEVPMIPRILTLSWYFLFGIIYIYTNEERLVGSISVLRNRVSNFYVLPEHRGKGIGTRLLNHAIEKVKSRGYPYFVGAVQPKDLRHYQRLNPVPVGFSFGLIAIVVPID